MIETFSTYTNSSRRRRTIHQPYKVQKAKNYSEAKTPSKGSTKSKKSNDYYEKGRKTSHTLLGHKDLYKPRGTIWDEFDALATEKSEEEANAMVTRMSFASDYNFTAPKLIPDVEKKSHWTKLRNPKNADSKRYLSSPKKATNYKIKNEEKDYVVKEVEVIYEEVSSLEQTKDPKHNKYNTAKPHHNFESPRRNKGYVSRNYNMNEDIDNEYLVKMDQSFNRDIKQASFRQHQQSMTSNRNTIKIDNKDDETLDLSPIHRSNRSFSEKSLEIDRERGEYDYDRDSYYQTEVRATKIDEPIKLDKLVSTLTKKKKKFKYYNPETEVTSPT